MVWAQMTMGHGTFFRSTTIFKYLVDRLGIYISTYQQLVSSGQGVAEIDRGVAVLPEEERRG